MKNYIRILVIILTVALILTACTGKKDDVENTPVNTPGTNEVTLEMPKLPDLNFNGMDFFEDGYEVVEYSSLSDGDTAVFVVGGQYLPTRFLAVDTPEMNSSTDGQQPWAGAAKEYTKNKLENAETIILEKDDNSDIWDSYDRLLAWIWVDGELLNYKLVEEGLAYVKYLYGDYKYNPQMIKLESSIQKKDIKIWGEDDPSFDYENTAMVATLGEARELPRGKNLIITAVVTNKIGSNAFIQDDTGAIYIYANRYNYSALVPGTRIQLTAKATEYNGLLELTDVQDKKITAIEDGIVIEPMKVDLSEVGEDIESMYIQVENLEITAVVNTDGEKGYSVLVKQGDATGIVRIDKYLNPYIESEFFKVGEVIDVIGNVGQFLDDYQIMVSGEDDIIK